MISSFPLRHLLPPLILTGILLHRQLTDLGVERLGLLLGMLSLDCTGAEHMLGMPATSR